MFNLSVDQITYEDVLRFCSVQQISEGTVVEYKADFPKQKLEKSISSFANTYGGILILGIACDTKTNRPLPPPFPGVTLETGLEERITGIALRSISPPVIPRVRIIPLPEDKNRCLIVVRVFESPQSPHAVFNNTRVYVRINSQSEPVEADQDRIRWLYDRRQRAVDFRESLKERVRERYRLKYKSKAFGQFEFHFVPKFPHDPVITRSDLRSRIPKFATPHVESWRFDTLYETNSLSEGIGAWPKKDRDGHDMGGPVHWEFNLFGGVHLISAWTKKRSIQGETKTIFNVYDWNILCRAFVAVIRQWLRELDWQGVADFEIRINGILDVAVYYIWTNDTFLHEPSRLSVCADDSVRGVSEVLSTGHELEGVQELRDLLQQVYWGLGLYPTDGSKTKWIEKQFDSILEDRKS